MTETNNSRYLFRGKRVDNEEWIEGDLMQHYIHHEGFLTIVQYGCVYHKVIPETVGQLLRPENKEKFEDAYFEGDIVKHPIWGYLKVTFDRENLEVVFEWPNGKSTYPVRMVKEYVLEVVGNIWDNPELLITK